MKTIMPDVPGPYCSRRLFEWTMAIAMGAFGVHVLMVPGTLTTSRYAGVLLVMSVHQFALSCILVGAVRLLALMRNGNWPHWGPRIRAMGAIAAAVIWLQLAVALGQGTPPSPGMWIYAVVFGAEIFSVIRARRDAHGPG